MRESPKQKTGLYLLWLCQVQKICRKKSDIDIILLAERVFILPKDNRSDESLWEKILESQEEEKNGLGNRCHDNPLS